MDHCEIMLKDMSDSKRINAFVHNKSRSATPSTREAEDEREEAPDANMQESGQERVPVIAPEGERDLPPVSLGITQANKGRERTDVSGGESVRPEDTQDVDATIVSGRDVLLISILHVKVFWCLILFDLLLV